MKQIKTTLPNQMREMKVTIESPETLVDKDLDKQGGKKIAVFSFYLK